LWTSLPGWAWHREEPSSRARQLLDVAREHHRAGRGEQALEVYRQVTEAAGTEDPATAAIAYNNRCYLLTERAEYRAALKDCDRALELRRSLRDQRGLARTLNNLGLVLQYLGRYDEARTRFREALDLNRRRDDLPAVALNLANLGNLATAMGDYEEALRSLAQAERLARKHEDEPWAGEQLAIVRLNRGVVFEKLGAYREALHLYQDIVAESEPMDPAHRAALKVNLGALPQSGGSGDGDRGVRRGRGDLPGAG
jgi:tetratricopeptide (TPR) repeat protein